MEDHVDANSSSRCVDLVSPKMSHKKNGYVQVPTVDSDEAPSTIEQKPFPQSTSWTNRLKPGLFISFGKDRHHVQSESEEVEMSTFKRKKPRHKRSKSSKSPTTKKPLVEVVEEPLLPGDTIQRVSLRYACPVAELRRINKLYNDTDFYALKTMKIPVRENGLLTDVAERERRRTVVAENLSKSGTQSSNSDDFHFGGPESYYNSDVSQDADDECGEESDTPEYRDISIQSALKWKHTGQSLLEKLDEDLQRVKEDQTNIHEVRLTFDTPSFHPVSVKEYTNTLFELPDWRLLLICAVGVIILIVIGAVVMCASDHCPFT